MTEWPESRLNIDGFYEDGHAGQNKLRSRGAHFLNQDPMAFDAPFFSITAKEAAAMDPQHRLSLEESYRAFENAGITVERLKGSRTSVFAASMTDDYTRMLAMDPDQLPRTTITGTAFSMLANRLSWYFDLLGPSVHVDTACSSSMVALDLACQSIHNKDATMALVVGVNMILGPGCSTLLSNGGFLSPSSRCHSFDKRADGYARGEGIVAIVIKPVINAIEDGDTIRAVVRSIGSNQDGRTPILTQPSASAQERLIRHVYQKSGLSLASTRFIEAHGTGTEIGDPIEIEAIGKVFGLHRSPLDPLYVGSIKGNVGHLEGSSGLAGVIKAVLSVERGIIPPNANFEELAPRTNAMYYNIEVPTEIKPWPTTGLRRVSVNSFGFGGTNSHAIIDDALHYLDSRGLVANHCTTLMPSTDPTKACMNFGIGAHPVLPLLTNGIKPALNTSNGRLLVWTAPDEKALDRVVGGFKKYYEHLISSCHPRVDDLSFTLAAKRTRMLWRTFAVVHPDTTDASSGLKYSRTLLTSKPVRAVSNTKLAFVFTGQGAQYAGMAKELLEYNVFRQTLQTIDDVFSRLGCPWSLFDEICRSETIDSPDRSQPLCTAVQIALLNLLTTFGVTPSAVVGHSSGEIAAAYCIGALSLESACKVAYYRGSLAKKLQTITSMPGAMLSVNLPEQEVRPRLEHLYPSDSPDIYQIACINSPVNCTLSGPEKEIDIIKEFLDDQGVFARKLKTGVAYHSSAMRSLVSEYHRLMGSLVSAKETNKALMFSSVTGKIIPSSCTLSSPQYWVDNLVSPVLFSEALRDLIQCNMKFAITDLLEIGPHPALHRSILDILAHMKKDSIRSYHILRRNTSSLRTIHELAGQLFSRGYPISITTVNQQSPSKSRPTPFLVDCPAYPFDHSNSYSAEPWLSRNFRMREKASCELGTRAYDWNPLVSKWRRFLDLESIPWAQDHTVNGITMLPATGMVAMALEAVKLSCNQNRPLLGLVIKDASFLNPILVNESWENGIEAITELRREDSLHFNVNITTVTNGRWTECFKASIEAQVAEISISEVDGGMERQLKNQDIIERFHAANQSCTKQVDQKAFYSCCRESGYRYGKQFQLLNHISWDSRDTAIAIANVPTITHEDSLVHPALLDSAVHLLFTQATNGLTHLVPTRVPVKLPNAWISATGWPSSPTSSVRVLALRKSDIRSHILNGTVYISNENGSPLCVFEDIFLAPVSKAGEAEKNKPNLLYNIDWKPQLSLLSPQQIRNACETSRVDRDESKMRKYRKLLDNTLSTVIFKTLKQLSTEELQSSPQSMRKYLRWMEHYTQLNGALGQDISDQEIDAALGTLENLNPLWALVPEVARNLRPILLGDIDPLQVIFASDHVENLYNDICDSVCDGRLRSLIDLLSHENPNLRILEVGAGTGAMTRHILSVLGSIEAGRGGCWFAEYTYTDISPSFFEKAGKKFGELAGDRLVFKQLNIERAPIEQGLANGVYDIVIAGSVLHATRDLNVTLHNVCELLKPGGRLLCLEVVAPDNVTPNFTFGILPGWWLCNDKCRDIYPAITEEQWDRQFQASGFSGTDLVWRDYEDDNCHLFSLMVSTRMGSKIVENGHSNRVFLVLPDDVTQQDLGDSGLPNLLHRSLKSHETFLLDMPGFNRTKLIDSDIVISLVEMHAPYLAAISEASFLLVRDMIKRAKNLLWVSFTNLHDENYAKQCLMQGFLRSIRSENIDMRIVSMVIENSSSLSIADQELAAQVMTVFRSSFYMDSSELEYIYRNGQLRIGRLTEESVVNNTLRSMVNPQMRTEPLQPGECVKLAVNVAGFLDTLELVEEVSENNDLSPDEVEIETKAWGLSFRDVLLALGRFEGDFGFDYSGVVKRVGVSVISFLKPGDRVCGVRPGCMRTYLQVSATDVVKIPDSISFEMAASFLSPGITAYYSLVHAARLRKGEKILIHAGSGSTGQMAISIAKSIGAEIFATVGSNEKKNFLIDKFGLQADHIFYSRDLTFALGVMRMTKGYGVDVLVNSLSGQGLRASWNCMSPHGRFIELGKADIMANQCLPMGGFARNVTFLGVDLLHIVESDQNLTRALVHDTMSFVLSDTARFPVPIHIYPVSDMEQSFRFLQSGKSTGRIVIRTNDSSPVRKRLSERRDWTLNSEASYVVAGGLGGLGRGIAKWMARKGVKHLILLSRSGPTSKTAAQVIQDLEDQGVQVAAPRCDVSSIEDLSCVLEDCIGRGMPPIKGCINAAMVLQDAVFNNMTHAQWDLTVRSKVQTSLNLHQKLPKALDFFILLSSLAGVHGSIAQSNYAAGCSAQDALARHRVTLGQKGIALDIGWMRDIGIISEVGAYQVQRRNAGDMAQIEASELMSLLDLYCDPTKPLSSIDKAQLLVGVVTPSYQIAQNLPTPELTRRPLFGGFLRASRTTGHVQAQGPAKEDIVAHGPTLYRLSTTVEGRVKVVVQVLAARLARALDIAADDVDENKQLSDYGVDSLMAVELRNWLTHDFHANVTVFDIMNGASLIAIAKLVVASSDIAVQ